MATKAREQPEVPAVGRTTFLGLTRLLTFAVVTGRLLFPSEDASGGSGVEFVLIELFTGVVAAICVLMGHARFRIGIAFIGAGLLLVLIWISSLYADYWFAAQVMAWEFTGIAAVCFAVTVTFSSLRPMLMLIVALVFAQSLVAGWQVSVELPEMRAAYERRDPAILRQMQMMGIEPGTTQESRFRDRLFGTEPFGAFAHPGTLAGFIIFGLPLVGVFAAAVWNASRHWAKRGIAIALIALPTQILLLSKSRSSWLAAMAMLTVYVAQQPRVGRIIYQHRYRITIGLIVFAIMVAVTIGIGILDRQVLTEAPKSLSYRFEWWQASIEIIRSNPWLGVGFGNFAHHYLPHKLPFSSEEIQDPHNFIIEWWCCAGLFVLLGYLVLIGFALSSLRKAVVATTDGNYEANQIEPPVWWFGVIIGVGLIVLLAPLDGNVPVNAVIGTLVAMTLVAATAAEFDAKFKQRAIQAVIAGALGIHVHWFFSGGLSFTGLTLVVWVLVCAAANSRTTESRYAPTGANSRIGDGFLVIVSTTAFGLFTFNIFSPLQQRDQIMNQIRISSRRASTSAEREMYVAAARSLPNDSSGWVRLASWNDIQLDQARNRLEKSIAYEAAVEAWRQAIDVEPKKSAHYRSLAKTYQTAAVLGLDGDARDRAIKAFDKMVELYPHSAVRRWELANELMLSGAVDRARDEFAKALWLDQTPHPDKKLTGQQRRIAQSVAGENAD